MNIINQNFKEEIVYIWNVYKSSIVMYAVFICVVIMTIILTSNHQSQEKQDVYYVPVSHITIQKALEAGEHLYRMDPVTGAMIHSEDCPNPLK
jgi:hypothetical protein